MRISLLITSFGKTGIEISMIRLANGMLRAGHEVDLVVMIDNEPSLRTFLDSGVRIVDLKSPRLWTSLRALVRYMRWERPTAMIAAAPLANGFAGLAKRLSGVPTVVVLTEHGLRLFGFAEGRSFRFRILRLLLERGYREADALVGVSKHVAAELQKLKCIAHDRVHVIRNPVWSPELGDAGKEGPNHPWFNSCDRVPVVVSAGRLEKEKGFDILINAVANVNKECAVRLLILGEGGERENLTQLIKELGLQGSVHLVGFVRNPISYMCRSSAYVHASWRDALPTVIIEALACGIPVVSTDCPTGPREILQDGHYGDLVPVGDAEALAKAIKEVLSKDVNRSALIGRAQCFSVDNAVGQYLKLIEMLDAGRA